MYGRKHFSSGHAQQESDVLANALKRNWLQIGTQRYCFVVDFVPSNKVFFEKSCFFTSASVPGGRRWPSPSRVFFDHRISLSSAGFFSVTEILGVEFIRARCHCDTCSFGLVVFLRSSRFIAFCSQHVSRDVSERVLILGSCQRHGDPWSPWDGVFQMNSFEPLSSQTRDARM